MFWPTGAPRTATTSSRRREAHTKPVASEGMDPPGDGSVCASVEEMERKVSIRQELIDSYLELSSLMYFGTSQPFSEILRDRQEPDDIQGRNAMDEALIANMSMVKTEKISKKEEKLQAKTLPVVYTPLDVLLSNMREPELIDTWSPREIAILIASISKHGESASDIAPYFSAKTIDDISIFIKDVFNKTQFSRNFNK